MNWLLARFSKDRGAPQDAESTEGPCPSDTLLSVSRLVKHFPLRGSSDLVHAVNDVSFEVQPGETLALVGESGSGKSTTGHCILKLIEPTSGHIYFQGQDITMMSDRSFCRLRPRIQMLFQEAYESLDPRMTIGQILEENIYLEGRLDTGQREQRIRELMDMIGLPYSYLTRYPYELTGGENQRVAIARAISTQPDLLVLDEPTSALDISVRFEIIELLIRLQREFGLSYLFISHDLTAVREISHRVAIMYLGKIIEVAATLKMFECQLHPYGQALLSSVLLPTPNAVEDDRVILKGEIPSPVELPKGCYLHQRCPFAEQKCRQDPFPPMESYFDGKRKAACWFARKFLPR